MTLTAHHRPAKGNASTSFLSTTSTNIENENDVSPIEKSTIIEETVTVATPTAPDAAQANATAAAAAVEPAQGAERKYPEGIKLFLIMVPVYISLFLVSLDRIIIATAIPRITDEFQSFGDIEWYGSAYMLTTAAFMLLLGRVYTFFNVKWTYLSCVLLFEVGSLICGVAQSSPVFIVGRAIAGLGCAGIMNGGIIIILHVVPLHKRPLFQASFAAVFGFSSVIGPLLGGVFTTEVSWRWCFFINLPFGGVSLALLFFFLQIPAKPQAAKVPLLKQLMKLDLVGTPLFVGSIACLLLAMQWGGSKYAWSSGRIITLFIVFAVTFIAFIAVQYLMPKSAQLPLRLFKNRTVVSGTWFGFCVGGAMNILVYYTAVWLQAIKNTTAIRSGVLTIPMIACMVVGSVTAGAIAQRTGWLNPWAIGGACLMPLGAGLLYLLEPTSNLGLFQVFVIFGLGLGMCMQQSNLAIQVVLPMADVSTGISLVMVTQMLGGAIGIAIGQTVLNNKLASGLAGISGLSNADTILNLGATQFRNEVAPQYLSQVLDAYNAALVAVFYVGMGMSLCVIPGALGLEWKNLKRAREEKGQMVQQVKAVEEEKGKIAGEAVTEEV